MMEAQAGYDRPGRAPDRRRPAPGSSTCAPRSAEAYDAEMQARLGRQRVGGLRLLVPRRRPDHHELAGPGRRVPAAHRERRLGRARRGRHVPSLTPASDLERLVEVLEQVRRVAVDRDRAGLEQLGPAVATAEQAHRGQALPGGRLHVPHGVADHEATLATDPRERLVEQLGVGLGRLGVRAAGRGVRRARRRAAGRRPASCAWGRPTRRARPTGRAGRARRAARAHPRAAGSAR